MYTRDYPFGNSAIVIVALFMLVLGNAENSSPRLVMVEAPNTKPAIADERIRRMKICKNNKERIQRTHGISTVPTKEGWYYLVISEQLPKTS